MEVKNVDKLLDTVRFSRPLEENCEIKYGNQLICPDNFERNSKTTISTPINGECHKCASPGHIDSFCPLQKCYFCNKFGHNIKYCHDYYHYNKYSRHSN